MTLSIMFFIVLGITIIGAAATYSARPKVVRLGEMTFQSGTTALFLAMLLSLNKIA